MIERIIPVAGKLVVRPCDEYVSPAGLILADSCKRPHSGIVLGIGKGVLEALGVALHENVRVVYEYAAGATFDLKDGTPQGAKWIVLDVKDVLGIVVEE